jgi:putative phage-type endonuclease
MVFTDEELLARRRSLGASEVAAVVGLNPWRSAHDVWCVKRGLLDEEPTTASRVGTLIEPVIKQLYIEDTSATVEYRGTIRHPSIPWATATPDGHVVGLPRLLEIKCVGWRSATHWTTEDDGIPDYYRTQVEWQMEVCGADECDVAALIGGTDFRVYRIRRDPSLAAALLESCAKFWALVESGTPPTADHSDGARRMLAKLYPRDTRPLLPAPDDVVTTAQSLLMVRSEIKSLEKDEAALENKLREAVADAAGFIGDGIKITAKADKNGRRPLKVTAKEAA